MKFDAGVMLCSVLLSVATAQTSSAADARPATDAKPATEEPSESPRFLHDDHQVTPGSAIIGGKAVYVGSLVDGMRVTAISPNSVTLAGGGHIKTLVVGEP